MPLLVPPMAKARLGSVGPGMEQNHESNTAYSSASVCSTCDEPLSTVNIRIGFVMS